MDQAKLLKIISAVIFILLVGIFFLVRSTEQSLKVSQALKPKPFAAAEKPNLISSANNDHGKFVPPQSSRVEDLGIIITDVVTQPKNQEEWDSFMLKNIKPSVDALPAQQREELFKEAQKSPEDYEKRLKEVDERIKTFEERLEKNPYDAEASQRIDNLRQLKAIGKMLRDDVIKMEDAPAQ